ncbi:hypothetical protein LINPERHAP1_LOCUS21950 [Linum perenne]
MDSLTASLILTKICDVSHQHAREVLHFRELLDREWTMHLKHVYREGNKVDHYNLASLGHDLGPGLHIISCSDHGLRGIFFV